jgi:hypothetical protein
MEIPELEKNENESSIDSENEIPGVTEGIAAAAFEAEEISDNGEMKPSH